MPAQTYCELYWELLEDRQEKLYHELGLESLYLRLNTKHKFFRNSFFPYTLILDPNLRSAASLSALKKNLLKFIRPSPNSVFNCHNCKGIKHLTRLHLGTSHFREYKFKHSFQDTLNLFYSCSVNVETNANFFSLLPLVY